MESMTNSSVMIGRHESVCVRCGGLLVTELCMDYLSTKGSDCPAKRCVQCGDIVDPLIQRHRLFRQQASSVKTMTVTFAETVFGRRI